MAAAVRFTCPVAAVAGWSAACAGAANGRSGRVRLPSPRPGRVGDDSSTLPAPGRSTRPRGCLPAAGVHALELPVRTCWCSSRRAPVDDLRPPDPGSCGSLHRARRPADLRGAGHGAARRTGRSTADRDSADRAVDGGAPPAASGRSGRGTGGCGRVRPGRPSPDDRSHAPELSGPATSPAPIRTRALGDGTDGDGVGDCGTGPAGGTSGAGVGVGGSGDRIGWAAAVAELRRLRRDETAADDRDEWAAAADLRVLFPGRTSDTMSGRPGST